MTTDDASSTGWNALDHWGDAVRVDKMVDGVANDVWSVRLGDRLVVGRLGRRSDADLEWEADLLDHLGALGFAVPSRIPTLDGRRAVDGLTLMTWVDGEAPNGASEWRRVADTVRALHEATIGWPQRPGWCSSADLLTRDRGTKVDLTAMPAEGVARCRHAWRRLAGSPVSVVHGDLNPGNIRVTPTAVGLIDWDEAHVDHTVLDLVLPGNAAELPDDLLDLAGQASSAWEAAVCWDDEYARRRLAEVRPSAGREAVGVLVEDPLEEVVGPVEPGVADEE